MDVDDDRGTVQRAQWSTFVGPRPSVGWLKAEASSVAGKEAKLTQ